MIYRSFHGTEVQTSLLGMGCMRLPTVAGTRDEIDAEKAQALVDYAYAHGVNYFDTAYVYHGGKSEGFIGKALRRYPRESYFLADKLPGFELRPTDTRERLETLFQEQLDRCGVDYFDFYLCHNVNEMDIDTYLGLHVPEFFMELKKQGRIRYMGFSSHGTPETLRRYASAFPWDFAQIQLNYLDWDMQDAKQQYEILTELGIPVVVMEPCRGGRLSALCPEADAALTAARPGQSVASWAFRYVQALPNVQVILSGMTQLYQVEDNVKTFEREDPLTDAEREILAGAVQTLRERVTVPCTACRYCGECPQKLDIPALMTAYNEFAFSGSPMSLGGIARLPEAQQPRNCRKCGLCAKACPQHIAVPDVLGKLADAIAAMPPRP